MLNLPGISYSLGTKSIATPDFAKRDSMRDLTGLFESLYSWIQLGARYQTTVASIDDALFGFSLRKDHSRRYHFATSQFALLTGLSAFGVDGGQF